MSNFRQIMDLEGDGLGLDRIGTFLDQFLDGVTGDVRKLLIVPPDITRLHSRAGWIAAYLYKRLSSHLDAWVLPALGTHFPMTREQCSLMFGEAIPYDRILPHRWRHDCLCPGEIGGDTMAGLSHGRLQMPVQVMVNKAVVGGEFDMVLSLGQVVPHEVVGMANYTKNIVIGLGGPDVINKSHFLSALCGIESILGSVQNPVRTLIDRVFDTFIRPKVDVRFIMTVVESGEAEDRIRGIFEGAQNDAFHAAASLSTRYNIHQLGQPVHRAVVYLDPQSYHSTWLGNKAIYRLRKAMADGGELIVIAPGLNSFGEDEEIDRLIRKYGYCDSAAVMEKVTEQADLAGNLSAAAHLIHSSTEGRFRVTYAPADSLGEQAIRQVGYDYLPADEAIRRYQPHQRKAGYQVLDHGEEIYFVPNPAAGLWEV